MLTNHFSQASGRIATKLAHDGLQVSVHPRCAHGQGQGQRSRDTGTFVLAWKSLLGDYWDTWNYSLFASSLQSTISCISIKFARWQHDCGRSLLSTIALFSTEFGYNIHSVFKWDEWVSERMTGFYKALTGTAQLACHYGHWPRVGISGLDFGLGIDSSSMVSVLGF